MADWRRRAIAAGVAVPTALVTVVGVEALIAGTRQYPGDPGYVVEATVGPPGRPTDDEPLRIVVLGDSTAVGVGTDAVDDSLAVQTAQRVADAVGRPVSVRGLGVSGATTADVLRDQVDQLSPGAYDVVVVVIGSNDVTHLTPPWRLDDATTALLTRAHTRSEAPLVLGGIPLFGGATAMAQPLRFVVDSYARILRRQQRRAAEATPGVTYVNIAVEASPRFEGVPDAMSPDGFHPGATGYGFWADALAPAIVDASA